jgi:hypothetical protein
MACCILTAAGVATILAITARFFGGSKAEKTDPVTWRLQAEDNDDAV